MGDKIGTEGEAAALHELLGREEPDIKSRGLALPEAVVDGLANFGIAAYILLQLPCKVAKESTLEVRVAGKVEDCRKPPRVFRLTAQPFQGPVLPGRRCRW